MTVPYYGDFPVGHTGVVIPFNAFTSNDPSASATITEFANTDVHIHKNGSLTQRASAAGVAIDIDVDAITGGHWITIDLSDNTDAGFYAAGSEISVRIEGVVVDAGTVNAFVGAFSIERAGGTIALLKLLQAAVITNAAGADVAADIIALKAVADAIPTTAMRGTDNAALASVLGAAVGASISADVAAVKSDTGNILTDTGTTLENRLIAIEADTSELQVDDTPAAIAALDAVVDTVKVDTAAIKVITDALTAAAAAKLAASAGTMILGTVGATDLTTTTCSTDISLTDADQLNGRVIGFLSGTTTAGLRYQATNITDFVVANGVLTFTAITQAPVAGDTFIIY